MTEEELFHKHFPHFDENEIANAATENSVVVSFRGRKGLPDVFVAAFATPTTVYRPIVMTRTAAQQLRRALEQEGF
jgi:hypothetical protein